MPSTGYRLDQLSHLCAGALTKDTVEVFMAQIAGTGLPFNFNNAIQRLAFLPTTPRSPLQLTLKYIVLS